MKDFVVEFVPVDFTTLFLYLTMHLYLISFPVDGCRILFLSIVVYSWCPDFLIDVMTVNSCSDSKFKEFSLSMTKALRYKDTSSNILSIFC